MEREKKRVERNCLEFGVMLREGEGEGEGEGVMREILAWEEIKGLSGVIREIKTKCLFIFELFGGAQEKRPRVEKKSAEFR